MKTAGAHNRWRMFKANRAFSLIEVMTVLVILAIMLAIFHTVFITNWMAVQDRIIRADLWMDANRIVDLITEDVRVSDRFEISPDGQEVKTFNLGDDPDVPSAVYVIRESVLEFRRAPAAVFSVLSRNVGPGSIIDEQGGVLEIRLVLREDLFGRMVTVSTATHIYPRN